ncbi:cupin domain-containing protein [Flagellimonas hymeniacidonis]|uniref:Cupin domain-containing protein n=1 Tax=Flagellimonas hymeniacidonis TaxID=2603628 RepID=A0A5C8V9H1_9FLAO|nr:cupin domain-containing protein [Flagellimonas hymeniacidonis]TXN37850.1 cupin domain-containing protein [Flagellimonas hymeniacidonis]
MEENIFEDTLADKSHVVLPSEGETLKMKGVAITFKVTSGQTGNQLGIYEIVLQPKTIGANLHYHRFMDETFIVTHGMLTMMVDKQIKQAPKGTVVFVPRFTPHGFRNDSNSVVKLMLIFNPSMKREGFFRGLHMTLTENPIDPSKYLKLYNKYDSFPVDLDNMLPISKQ